MDKGIIFAVLTIPIILTISLTVFEGFFQSNQETFETSVVNESLGTGAGTYYTDYPAKVDSATVYNGTTVCPSSVCVIDYRSETQPAKVTVGSEAGSTAIKISYTAFSKSGYTQMVKTYQQTQSGYNLGALLPFVLIAMTIVGVIVGAFKLR
ncbi:hypothetical protein DRJ16_00045 [Candidatus Woesearchaeota archaeon]|nr:MAG: hypothetical protein DRJ16_00045 [Candidatus Woesearchaeota archaeon]